MSVVTFLGYRPPARYDEPTPLAWTEARIEEATTATGTYNAIETITLDPVEADPTSPQLRNLTTEEASDTMGLWYRIVWLDADGDESQPTDPVQNLATAGTPYATVAELARVLKIRAPSTEETVAMQRALVAAAGEIDAELGLDENDLTGWQLSLVAGVNLDRAVEHWNQWQMPFGIIGLGSELGGVHTARDSWERHAHKLAPLKETWGFA